LGRTRRLATRFSIGRSRGVESPARTIEDGSAIGTSVHSAHYECAMLFDLAPQ
jgi:hypothetical protein